VFVPLFVGRLATAAFIKRNLHDGYNLVGSTLYWRSRGVLSNSP
jgi:hypothetical protein